MFIFRSLVVQEHEQRKVNDGEGEEVEVNGMVEPLVDCVDEGQQPVHFAIVLWVLAAFGGCQLANSSLDWKATN